MNRRVRVVPAASLLLTGLILGATPVRAELFEEIVAWVNGEIITKGDLEQEEQAMVAEAYRRFTGDELDRNVASLRQHLLIEMVDRKILLDRAKSMFSDLEGVKQSYYEGFKESQGVKDDAEFERMLKTEGMTLDGFKQRLLELYAPDEVLRYEVGNRVAVSDKELEEYYQAHPEGFMLEDTVTVREIVLLADSDDEKALRRAEADAIVERIRNGEDFGEVAQEVSDAGTKTQGGLLGEVKRGHLSAQLEAVAFDMDEGEVSAPIETPYGYHILFVEKSNVGVKLSLEESRERLRAFLEDKKYEDALQEFKKKIRAEAEWCVKAKYKDRIAPEVDAAVCETL